MKYVAIIDSDDELSEEAIRNVKDCVFVGDKKTPFRFDITSIKQAPEPVGDHIIGFFKEGYNQALEDCGVIEGEKRTYSC